MSNDDFYRSPAILRGEHLPRPNPASVGTGVWPLTVEPLAKASTSPAPTPRHIAYAAAGVNQEIVGAEAKLNDLSKAIRQTASSVMDLDISVARMTNSLRAPGSELADARDEIARLEKQNQALIKEAQRQKRRADRAEIQQPEIEKSKPGEVAFLRRTPGDAIRYFATEVMKHGEADTNPFLMGAAMGLRMVADDVDRLPQG
ncbi:hypothetical protein [Streptomyces mirabilis]|uniref:hypothetical protein n=1 Tax=Streptomyces mirabilis TaxID=68239 RepID=UPI003696F418